MQDIGDLEGYVRATGVMLFFLSKHYFTSRNCLREVKATIDEKLPLVLVHEQQEEKGGGPLEMMRAECRKEMRPYVFDGRAPIAWHRISHYQNLTLKLIATEMLRGTAPSTTIRCKTRHRSSRVSLPDLIVSATPRRGRS